MPSASTADWPNDARISRSRNDGRVREQTMPALTSRASRSTTIAGGRATACLARQFRRQPRHAVQAVPAASARHRTRTRRAAATPTRCGWYPAPSRNTDILDGPARRFLRICSLWKSGSFIKSFEHVVPVRTPQSFRHSRRYLLHVIDYATCSAHECRLGRARKCADIPLAGWRFVCASSLGGLVVGLTPRECAAPRMPRPADLAAGPGYRSMIFQYESFRTTFPCRNSQ